MSQYRKRPVVNEAQQWTGDNIRELWDWMGVGALLGPAPADQVVVARPARLWVAANSAWLDLEVGEWIIQDVRGFCPCKPDIFAATYEAVEVEA